MLRPGLARVRLGARRRARGGLHTIVGGPAGGLNGCGPGGDSVGISWHPDRTAAGFRIGLDPPSWVSPWAGWPTAETGANIVGLGISPGAWPQQQYGIAKSYWQLVARASGYGVGEAALRPSSHPCWCRGLLPARRRGRAVWVCTQWACSLGIGLAPRSAVRSSGNCPAGRPCRYRHRQAGRLACHLHGGRVAGLLVALWVRTSRTAATRPYHRRRSVGAACPRWRPLRGRAGLFLRRFARFALLALAFNAVTSLDGAVPGTHPGREPALSAHRSA